MPSFLVPLHEHNDCHTPAGSSAGGQFCGTGGGKGKGKGKAADDPDREGFEFVMRDASRRGASQRDIQQMDAGNLNFRVRLRGYPTIIPVARVASGMFRLPDDDTDYTMDQAREKAVARIRKAHA
jgi:hypothetical protein